ncbi:YlbL family protein [Aeromicrobium terrae]|uniref:endopeptidase La n=1 Tax=Aeromicrobium terrae TaxID=2498846 RepID=A0A5C8NJI4_9ACTN|nr:PDZ domain-containing protein [Aeromicrobium terrae]TXL61448.1 PDZ domain-containing protein [Aeromicrobium terrae]
MPDAVDPTGPSPRYATMLTAALSVIVLSCVAFLVPVPYVTMRPGPAFNTLGEFEGKPMFTFGSDVKTYDDTKGSLDFTTVSVSREESRLSIFDAVKTYFSDDTAVVPKSFVYRDGESQKQSDAEGAAQLSSSKDNSRVAALRAAGYTVPEIPLVKSVDAKGAAAGTLRTDDEILSVDGKKMATAEQVVRSVSGLEPGDTVSIEIRRKGETKTFDIVTKPDAKDPKKPRVGVGLGSRFDYPVKITNNVGSSIGGPSAGTMFALAIYDRLTPGPLTGGLRVAGTGEISPEGVVGPIGGIRQKIAGAAKDDVEVFLVPAENCAEALKGDDHGLTLVRISTLKGAISALEKLAQDHDAKVPQCR